MCFWIVDTGSSELRAEIIGWFVFNIKFIRVQMYKSWVVI